MACRPFSAHSQSSSRRSANTVVMTNELKLVACAIRPIVSARWRWRSIRCPGPNVIWPTMRMEGGEISCPEGRGRRERKREVKRGWRVNGEREAGRDDESKKEGKKAKE